MRSVVIAVNVPDFDSGASLLFTEVAQLFGEDMAVAFDFPVGTPTAAVGDSPDFLDVDVHHLTGWFRDDHDGVGAQFERNS